MQSDYLKRKYIILRAGTSSWGESVIAPPVTITTGSNTPPVLIQSIVKILIDAQNIVLISFIDRMAYIFDKEVNTSHFKNTLKNFEQCE